MFKHLLAQMFTCQFFDPEEFIISVGVAQNIFKTFPMYLKISL